MKNPFVAIDDFLIDIVFQKLVDFSSGRLNCSKYMLADIICVISAIISYLLSYLSDALTLGNGLAILFTTTMIKLMNNRAKSREASSYGFMPWTRLRDRNLRIIMLFLSIITCLVKEKISREDLYEFISSYLMITPLWIAACCDGPDFKSWFSIDLNFRFVLGLK